MGYAEKPLPDPTEEPISSKRGRKEKEGEKVGPDGISCVEVVEKQRRNHHRHPPLSPTTPVQEEDAVSELTMRLRGDHGPHRCQPAHGLLRGG